MQLRWTEDGNQIASSTEHRWHSFFVTKKAYTIKRSISTSVGVPLDVARTVAGRLRVLVPLVLSTILVQGGRRRMRLSDPVFQI